MTDKPRSIIARFFIGIWNFVDGTRRLVLNLLAQEGGGEAVPHEAAEAGRAYHRAWVVRCFGPWAQEPDPQVVDALVAATDLYVWKLLRLDLGRTRRATEAVVARLVRSVLEAS